MSYFSVLVIGENVEEQLKPFKENNMGDCPKEYLKFVNVEEECKKKYETGITSEFYCNSSSSWGQEISKENFFKLENSKVGDFVILDLKRSGFHYFEKDKYYHCYSYSTIHKYPEKHIWVKVISILESNHPDRDVCFEGKIRVELINDPKEIPLKVRYP